MLQAFSITFLSSWLMHGMTTIPNLQVSVSKFELSSWLSFKWELRHLVRLCKCAIC